MSDEGVDDLCRLVRTAVDARLVVEGRVCGSSDHLLPEEAAEVASWAPMRRAEFAAGRTAARLAMGRLGAAAKPVLFDSVGVPHWPAEVVGSISHKHGRCLATVGRSRDFRSVGVDLEFADDSDGSIEATVCTAAERARLGQVRSLCDWPLALVFAAKEALYKCRFPVTRVDLDWHDVEIAVTAGSLHAVPTGSCSEPFPPSSGVFVQAGRWIVASFVL